MSRPSPTADPPAGPTRFAAQCNAAASPASRHDIIVIGASAGGLEPLNQVLAALPADLPATIFVVLHLGSRSQLAQILQHSSKLPVHAAVSGAIIEPGHVHVAIPGCHLMLHDRHILLRRGPRENLARPAIDPLFRSAACSFGARVVGVVLSGMLNDGTAGLRAIKRCGGVTVVQDPSNATYSDMPDDALRHIAVDHTAKAHEIGALLAHLAHEPAGQTPDIPFDLRLEAAIAAQELASMEANQRLGTPSEFSCPECHGVLWQIDDGGLLRYRCHVGHAYTAEAVHADQSTRTEELLWNLLRNHQERAALADRMAEQERSLHHEDAAAMLHHRARGYEEDAEIIRRLLQSAGADEPAGGQEEMP